MNAVAPVVGGLAATVAVVDLVTKAAARRTPATTLPPAPERPLGPSMLRHEHPGPRWLGAAVAGAPVALGVAGAWAVIRGGGPTVPALAGAALLATGGLLNGAELAVRGSNTNPMMLLGTPFNVADAALAGGVAVLGASALPVLLRLVR